MAARLGRSKAVEWSCHSGKSSYTATGSRDVLFISSDSLPSSTLPGILKKAVPRRDNAYGLAEDEAITLESQGVPRESQDSDVSVLMARHRLDQRHNVVAVLQQTSCSQVKSEISSLLNTTDKEGVVVCYVGQGKLDTGDWCFSDGFLSFQEIYKLYTSSSHFSGRRVLSIITDCSYSGHWVLECMEAMDGEGISPCGHSARNKAILIKLLASCQPTEIPQKLSLSVLGARNEKNSGLLSFSTQYKGAEIRPKQHPSGVDGTHITCRRGMDTSCGLAESYTWRKWQESKRIQLFTTVENGKEKWYYIMLTEDADKVSEFTEKMSKGHCSITLTEYGRVLLRGLGDKPSNQAKDLLCKKYLPVYT